MNGIPLPSPSDTSSSLLTRARKQDGEAWLQLVRWIGPFILRWCRKAGLQSSDCDDVSQQVILKLWNRLDTFRQDRPADSFRAWVYAITRNALLDFFALQRQSPGLLSPADLPAAHDSFALASQSEAQELEQAALQLILDQHLAVWQTDTGFQAFYRSAVDGLTSPEVALELGISPEAVRQHKSRWIKRLREQLGGQFGDLLG